MTQYLHEWCIKIRFARCLRAFAELQHAYFACYLQEDYISKQSSYEKILHEKRLLSLSRIERARSFLQKNQSIPKKWHAIFFKIEQLSEIIFSLNLLRFRVKDRALFEMCIVEMQGLQKASIAALKGFEKFIFLNKPMIYIAELLDSIHQFESISKRTLQVVSREPIVFLFFTQDLYALYDGLNE